MKREIIIFLPTIKLQSLNPGGGRGDSKLLQLHRIPETSNTITLPLFSSLVSCIFYDLSHYVYCTNLLRLLYSCIQSSTRYFYLQVSNAPQMGFPKPAPSALFVFALQQSHKVISDFFSLSFPTKSKQVSLASSLAPAFLSSLFVLLPALTALCTVPEHIMPFSFLRLPKPTSSQIIPTQFTWQTLVHPL